MHSVCVLQGTDLPQQYRSPAAVTAADPAGPAATKTTPGSSRGTGDGRVSASPAAHKVRARLSGGCLSVGWGCLSGDCLSGGAAWLRGVRTDKVAFGVRRRGDAARGARGRVQHDSSSAAQQRGEHGFARLMTKANEQGNDHG